MAKISVKEDKQIDKDTAAVVKEAVAIVSTPPEPKIVSQLKGMSHEDRSMYAEVVDRRLEEVDRMTGELSQEAESIKEYLATDPVATYRARIGVKKLIDKEATKIEGKKVWKQVPVHFGLTQLLSKTGEWPDTITKKQANLVLMGRELKANALTPGGRVRWAYVLDELADHFKMDEQEFINHVENLADQKARLGDMGSLIKEADDRGKELLEIRAAITKYNEEQRHVKLPEISGPKAAPVEEAVVVAQVAGTPEAGLQNGMFGQDKEVRPEGKAKVVQVDIFEHGKLQAMKDAAKAEEKPVEHHAEEKPAAPAKRQPIKRERLTEIKTKVTKSPDLAGDLMAEVKKRQAERTPRAVASDNARTADTVFSDKNAVGVKRWLRHPEHADIQGVDAGKGAHITVHAKRRKAVDQRIRTTK